MWMEDLNDEESEASVYRKVDLEIPACIKRHAKTLKYGRARSLLQGILDDVHHVAKIDDISGCNARIGPIMRVPPGRLNGLGLEVSNVLATTACLLQDSPVCLTGNNRAA